MRLMRYLLIVAVLLIGVSFAILNPGTITLNYWIARKTLPLSLFVVIILALGIGVGLLMSALLFLGARLENFRLGRRLKVAEKEVRNLRVIPIKDRH